MTLEEKIQAALEGIRIVIDNLDGLDVYSNLSLLAALQFAHDVEWWLGEMLVEDGDGAPADVPSGRAADSSAGSEDPMGGDIFDEAIQSLHERYPDDSAPTSPGEPPFEDGMPF